MDNLSQGYNTSIILYGVTGSGKTHTVFGDLGNNRSQDKGIIYYATQQLFRDSKINLYLSYIEIYNETVTDLLQENSTDLMIMERGEGDVHVAGLSQIVVDSFENLVDWIKLGNRRRKMAKTNQNLFSSRSHAIIQLSLRKPIPESEDQDKNLSKENQIQNQYIQLGLMDPLEPEQKYIESKLSFIDLAGSERVCM
jgi:hypothetical protein